MLKSKAEHEILKDVIKNLANIGFGYSKVNDFEDFKMYFPNFIKDLLDDSGFPEWKNIPDTWIGKDVRKEERIKINYSIVMNYLIQKCPKFKFYKKDDSNYSDGDLISITCKILEVFFISRSEKSLTNKVLLYLKDFEPILKIENMTNSWINGIPYISILSKASNGTIENIDKGNSKSNYNIIRESFQLLNIPFVLTEECISQKPQIGICNCIQITLFFKSINYMDETDESNVLKTSEATQIQEKQNATRNQEISIIPKNQESPNTIAKQDIVNDQKRAEELKKYENKINEYNEAIHVTIKLLFEEKAKFEELSKCSCNEDITSLRNYCHKYNSSERAKCQQQIFKVYDLWGILKRRSDQLKMPIPDDLIKIDEVKQKFDHLNEIIKMKSENLNNEEINVKNHYDEIHNIDNLTDAREKYNQLKNEFDIDKWSQFKKESFIYILGEKLQRYENTLKETMNKYDSLIKEFNEIHESINNEIHNNSEDLNSFDIDSIQKYILNQNNMNSKKICYIQKSIKSLETIYDKIKDSFSSIKNIDPNIQIDISHDNFQLKQDSNNKIYNDLKQKDANTIKYSKYLTDYQSLCQKMMNIFDNDQNQFDSLKNISSYDDIQKIKDFISKYNESITNKKENIQNIENNLIHIEQISNIIQIPIPDDLIKIDEVKQKFDHLNEIIKMKSENLNNEEINVKNHYDEIHNIDNLTDAREKYNHLKNEFDMDKWSQFKKESFIYILGEKLQRYENTLKETMNKYDSLIKEFNEIHESINNEIHNNSEDLNSFDIDSIQKYILNQNNMNSKKICYIQKSIKSLETIYDKIKDSFSSIKNIDPNIQIDISHDNFQLKQDSNNKVYNDLKQKDANTIKYSKYLTDYQSLCQKMMNIFDNDQKQYDSLKNISSYDDIQKIKDFISKYNESITNKKENIQNIENNLIHIEQISNIIQIPIPDDLIKIDEVKQKFDHLNEIIKMKSENLNNEEINVKNHYDEIHNIDNLTDAREKYNHLKNEFDMDKWSQFKKESFIYILGEKLQRYENTLKETMNKYDSLIKEFNEIHESINNEIHNNSEDLNSFDIDSIQKYILNQNNMNSKKICYIQKSIKSLETIYDKIKDSFSSIKNIDPNIQIDISHDNFQLKQDSNNKVYNDLKQKDANTIKYSKYLTDYQSLCQKMMNIFDNDQKQYDSLKNISSYDDIQKIKDFISKYNESITNKKENIQNIENNLIHIEQISNIIQIPIPDDLIKIDEVKQKFDHLNEIIKMKSENLNNEEINVKNHYDEIHNIDNLTDAREKYNHLKNEFDMDKWSQFKKESFIYILGEKLQRYENTLKETMNKYDSLIKEFNEIHESINNEIHNNSEDLNSFDIDSIQKYILNQNNMNSKKICYIQKSIKSLETIYDKIKDSFSSIKNIDPNIQIDISHDNFQLKQDSNNKIYNDLKQKDANTIKYSKYLTDYQSLCQKMMNIFDNDQNQFDSLKNISSYDDIQKIKDFISKYNESITNKKENIQNIENNLIHIEQISNIIQIPIPDDLIKIDEVKQKFDHLNEIIKMKSENLNNEEINVKNHYDEIHNIDNLTDAREKYNHLKNEFDMDKWSQFKKESFIYILGEKLQRYENTLKETMNKYDSLIKEFNEIHESINNEIHNNSEDLNSFDIDSIQKYILNQNNMNSKKICYIQKSIKSLETIYDKIKDSFSSIKNIDPNIQIDISHDNFQLKQDSNNKVYNDLKQKDANTIKYSKYLTDYQSLCQKMMNIFDNDQKQYDSLKNISSYDDIQKIKDFISKYNESITNKKENIQNIENNLIHIEQISNIIQIPIPDDLIKIDEVKQKFDHLNEIIKMKSENLNNEEINVKNHYDEIHNIDNLTDAREKYNHLKNEFDMDKWSQFKKESFIYILGEKLQRYENTLKETMNKYDSLIKEFNEIHESINNEIHNNSEDLNSFDIDSIQKYILNQNNMNSKKICYIQKSIKSLETIYDKIKDSFSSIKNIDPNIQIDISHDNFQLKQDSNNKIYNDLKQKDANTIKYSKYLTDYQSLCQKMMNIFDNDQNQFDSLKNISSYDDIQKIKDFISKYNESITNKKENIQNIENNLIHIEQISNIIQIPIPDDLIKIDEVKQKFDHLNEIIKMKSENLNNEEINVKNHYDEIHNIDNLTDAREKYNHLKNEFDMDKWSQFKKESFIYILGEKLQRYENTLKETMNKYDSLIKEFNEIHESINNEIHNNSENLMQIQDSISKLNELFNYIKDFNKNIRQIDPSIQFAISENEIQLKIENANKDYEEYLKNVINSIIEKEYDSINCIAKNISLELEQFSKYDNQYSVDLYSKVKAEHSIIFPNYDKINNLLKLSPNNSEWLIKIEEVSKIFDNYKQEYDDKLKVIQKRQEECILIENELNKMKIILSNVQLYDLKASFNRLKEAIEQVGIVNDMKNWTNIAEGKTIDLYNQSIKYISTKMNEYTYKIKEAFNSTVEEIKLEVDEASLIYVNSPIMQEDDFYIYKMRRLNKFQTDIDDFQSIDELIHLGILYEIEASKLIIQQAKILIQQKIDIIQSKFKELIDQKLFEFEKDQEKIKKYLISESNKTNNIMNYNDKCEDILTQILKIDELKSENEKFLVKIDMSHANKIRESYECFYIFFKSTLLLNPDFRLQKLKKQFSEYGNQNIIICACSLYINIFRENKIDFDIKEEDLMKIEDFVQYVLASYYPFGINILQQIQRYITKPLNKRQMFEVELLSESIKCMEEPELYLLNSFEFINIFIRNNDEYFNLQEEIENNSKLTQNDQLIKILSKFKLLLKENDESFKKKGSFLFIDFGSFKIKYMYYEAETNGKQYNEYEPKITFQNSLRSRYDPSDYEKMESILDNYSDKEIENLIVCLHQHDEEKISLICKAVSKCYLYKKIKYFNFLSPYVGVVCNGKNDSGIAVDLGDLSLSIVPVFDYKELNECAIYHPHCGYDIALEFQNNLKPDSCFQMDIIKYSSTRKNELIWSMHNLVRVGINPKELKKYVNIGNHLITSSGSIQAPETILFNNTFNLSRKIIEVAKNASEKTNQNINIFLSNIVIGGGVSYTNGLIEKLKSDIKRQYPMADIIENGKFQQIDGLYTMASCTNFLLNQKDFI